MAMHILGDSGCIFASTNQSVSPHAERQADCERRQANKPRLGHELVEGRYGRVHPLRRMLVPLVLAGPLDEEFAKRPEQNSSQPSVRWFRPSK